MFLKPLSYLPLLAFLPLIAEAQPVTGLPPALQQPEASPVSALTDFSLEIDTVATNIGVLSDADLTGYNTYRIYVTTGSPTDQVSAVYGNVDEPSHLLCTGDIFQSYPVGDVTADGVLPDVWNAFPSNAHDSYVTIGIDGPPLSGTGQGSVTIIESSTSQWTSAFEPGAGAPGSGFSLDDITGGSWFTLPSNTNGIAGADRRVLLAQITTNGSLSGNLHIQLFLEGDNLNGTVYLDLALPTPGCTDPTACSYDPSATVEDGSCSFPEPGLDCGGQCLDDLDGDGICDENEVLGCTYLPACNFDADATDDDGSCTFALPGTDCAGDCLMDLDGDGICDQDDPCIGVVDACGICNGPGAIQECGCTALPLGDCDCGGQQWDAIGVCGGDCASDLDGDGICDDQEVSGCTEVAACNYSVDATDEDGSCTFAEPGEDCEGQCLDDADGDGICDGNEILGCTVASACNFDAAATEDDGSCLIPGDCDTCNGSDLTIGDTDGDGVCDPDEVGGCTDPDAPNFDPEATEDDGTCKVFGCTDLTAANYDPTATDEDGSCQYLCTGQAGCAYPDAGNYDPEAVCDNGTCVFDCASGSCAFDADGNGYIGSYDLLYFLTWIGLACTNE